MAQTGSQTRGVRKWRGFHCTYVAFIREVAYDCEFRAVVVRGRLSLRDPRWIGSPAAFLRG
jgi:hypothetical protein